MDLPIDPLEVPRKPRSGAAATDVSSSALMDEIKQLRADLAKQLTDVEERLTAKIDGRCGGLERQVEALTYQVGGLERGITDLGERSDGADHYIDMVAARCGTLEFNLDCVHNNFDPRVAALETSSTTIASGFVADGPVGHRYDNHTRDLQSGTTHTQIPDKGTLIPFHSSHTLAEHEQYRFSHDHVPKFDFSQFDGDNPKYWRTCCENYFDMYRVRPERWIRIATMYFTGRAQRWFQSVDKQLKHLSWDGFCALLLNRFGKEQHELLVKQLLHLKQSGSVSVYIEQFTDIVDQLTVYGADRDDVYFTVRFIDGLKYEIQSVIMVHRP